MEANLESGANGHEGGKDKIGNRRRVTVSEFRWEDNSIKESGKKLSSGMVSSIPGSGSRSEHSDRRMDQRVRNGLEILIPHFTISVRARRD